MFNDIYRIQCPLSDIFHHYKNHIQSLSLLSMFYTDHHTNCRYQLIYIYPHRKRGNCYLMTRSKFYMFDDRACISLHQKIYHPHRWDINLLNPLCMFYTFNGMACTQYRRERLRLYKQYIQSLSLLSIMYIIHDITRMLYHLNSVLFGIISTSLRKLRNTASNYNHISCHFGVLLYSCIKKLEGRHLKMFRMLSTSLHRLCRRECTCL